MERVERRTDVQGAFSLFRAAIALEKRVQQRTAELQELNRQLHVAKEEAVRANVSKTKRFRAGPPVTGSRVTVGEIFRYATRHMPAQNAFALSDDQYIRIMAAMLKQIGFPAGAIPLTYAVALRSTVAFPINASRIAPPKS